MCPTHLQDLTQNPSGLSFVKPEANTMVGGCLLKKRLNITNTKGAYASEGP